MQLSGSPLDFIIAFFAGFLASLTPCVYPLIPISSGYIIGNAQNSKSRALGLSLFYVTGMAITYSFLGVLAVLTGSIFGKFSSSPLVNLISGILIFTFGLFMLDIFHFNFSFHLKLPVYKKANFGGALLLGLVSGLMISPCLTPILGAILAYLSTTKNIFYGGFLLLSFSYGLGLIFVLIGISGAGMAGLPKSGKWMVAIKKVCACVIILSGVYFIFTAIRRF
ncbi:MAG: sulfite exporter TauE/SafE family protein [Candidatus Omnitrophica bacterium]|nr:sulfite exporter TauE/SafE family protein [Candidatus Omnitrophota bacterium]MBU4303608.1 sulfite exporter TauE/SafE family protein [Candidatus Omnitrophota bacterium]MBU4467826.1 sulfite exporter TauE/SafE family protein [Candidatus Omnitrophota bacterium]MCG2707936.1 sulfite exporter TauE/SafE family protein [Candidatus Omnitrophota bacterium]